VALHAVGLSGIEAGQAAVVTGAGPIGLLVVEVRKERGVQPILVSEPSGLRRAIAARLELDQVVDPSAVSLADLVRSQTGRGVHVVFECSGSPAAAELGLGLLRPAGSLMIVGSSERSFSLSTLMLMARELRVQGVYGNPGLYAAALEMLAAGKIHAQDIITRIVPLAEAEACLRELADSPVEGKVLVEPWL
ncbi:MAG: zinc-binding dehydrogenase, partial [Chloroflexota bacterium]|nr:zinc-binding dehydrogenase [Chloroflexota bacterium]